MAEVDLHLHTTFSDGRLTPTQLIDLLASRGLRYISVTDHDSTEGLAEAARAAQAHPGLTLIPGTEISTDAPGGECHILAYFVDTQNEGFRKKLSTFREDRVRRGQEMVEKLASLGKHISWERVKEFAGDGSVGRPHVARALVERGYVATMAEAFDRYLGKGCPAYVERRKVTPEEGIALAREAGGLPVLAHPSYVEGLDALVPSLKEAGLVGMEVYYKGYDERQVRALKAMADLYGLVPCGGSDFHANGERDEVQPGRVGPPVSTIEKLAALRQARRG
jgi:predicted metal-dependent phosphoesterase TrpH